MNVSELAQFVTQELKPLNVPACSFAVVSSEGIIASGAVGVADLALGKPASANTAYHLFSATKLYTATAILQLVEAGKLCLGTHLTEVLPDVSSDSLSRITVQHLLTHTSGLSDTLLAVAATRRLGEPAPSTADLLKRYRLKLSRQPGQKLSYANVNYVVLGDMLTRLSGQDYMEYVTERILQPLGMGAAFTYTQAMQADRATGYTGRWDLMLLAVPLLIPQLRWVVGEPAGSLVALRPYDIDSFPAGGLVGSAVAFAPFVVAHLRNGGGILAEKSALQMRQIAARGQAGFDAKVGMGLGWKVGDGQAHRFYNHEGGGVGFATETRIYPEQNLGMILLTNRSGTPVHRALHRICERISSRWR